MRRLYLVIFFALFGLNCFSQSENESKILGEWYYYDLSKFTFSRENIFQLQVGNKLLIEGTYSFVHNDTIRVFFENNLFIDYIYTYYNDTLVLYTYKSKYGPLKNHIDEIILLTRRNKVKSLPDTLINLQTDKFVLPVDYTGIVYVSYNQPKGQVQSFDNVKNRIIKIPSCGYTKTSFKEDPLQYALEKMCFIQNEEYIPFFIDSRITKMTESELKQAGFDYESKYVCVFGFNQASRENINDIFGEDIQGNVLMFQVDTLKNILENLRKY